ncbi:PD-(D/E)XK nuclease family protein [Candidatus Nitrosopelagicus sp.]|nr:PD-(D/E)XK nuclease family protein [Candidatus Nitrosopelagicus sp.]
MKTLTKFRKLYVTDMSDFVYCPRLFFMKKTMDIPRVETFPMHRGTIEHEIRRSIAKSLKVEYESCSSIDSLKSLDYKSCIENAIKYCLDLSLVVKSAFFLRLEEMLPQLSFRLELEEKQRLAQAILLREKGYSMKEIIEKLLPWKQECGVGSTTLGITGRVDQVFKQGDNLTPIDFKTHSSRFAGFIWRDAHKEQLILYSLLLEENYSGAKSNSAIIELTEDLHHDKFKITKLDKKNALNHIKEAKQLIQNRTLPPILTGSSAVKCSSCYFKNFCNSLESEVDQ